MAGLRDHPAATGSRPDRPRSIFARRASVPGLRTRRGPLRPPQTGHAVLLRIRRELRPAVAHRLAGKPFGTSDLRGGGAGRRGARIQRSGKPGASATTGAGRAFPQRSGLERQHLSGGNDSGSLDRRVSLRLLARPVGRLCDRNGHSDSRRVFYSEDHTTGPGAGA